MNKDCQAYALGNQAQRPVRKPKPSIPLHHLAAAVIRTGESVVLRQRPQGGLLGAMWEFPSVRIAKEKHGKLAKQGLRESLAAESSLQIQVGQQIAVFRHAYSHFRVSLQVFHCSLLPGSQPVRERRSTRLVPLKELGDYPMGKLDRQISQQLSNVITT
ncbi:MAG: NUDIX domain-containing protein [Chloroflexi bacterium]|nr:NUDIX domain-containing protein [Chloroflexota bacterium]